MMWHALGLLQEKRNYIELDSMSDKIEDILFFLLGFILARLYIRKYNLKKKCISKD